MKRFVLLGILICCSNLLIGQSFSSDMFHNGFVVSTSRDTIRGVLKYDMDANLVTIIDQGKAKTLSSHNIFYFEIFDVLVNNYRQFYSVPFNVSYNYKIPVLFELTYEGKISLMRREQITVQTVNAGTAYWGGVGGTQTVINYAYYFLDDEGKITYFSGKKKELLKILEDKEVYIKEFIKGNKLKVDETGDLIKVIAFYNSI